MNAGERQVYRHDIFRRRVPKKKRKKRRWNAFDSSLISGTRLATNSKSAAGLRFSFILILKILPLFSIFIPGKYILIGCRGN
jgi:hypothetical protein